MTQTELFSTGNGLSLGTPILTWPETATGAMNLYHGFKVSRRKLVYQHDTEETKRVENGRKLTTLLFSCRRLKVSDRQPQACRPRGVDAQEAPA